VKHIWGCGERGSGTELAVGISDHAAAQRCVSVDRHKRRWQATAASRAPCRNTSAATLTRTLARAVTSLVLRLERPPHVALECHEARAVRSDHGRHDLLIKQRVRRVRCPLAAPEHELTLRVRERQQGFREARAQARLVAVLRRPAGRGRGRSRECGGRYGRSGSQQFLQAHHTDNRTPTRTHLRVIRDVEAHAI